MFFELHEENVIGYKRLSKADLGLGEKSHQTHIGLSEYVLTYLPDRDQVSEESIFIYEDKFEYMDAYFDRIETPEGGFRSPKIRIGDKNCVSIVSTIRNIVQGHDSLVKWYLLWFGLKSEKLVFFLFNSKSDDFRDIRELIPKIDSFGAKSISSKKETFGKLTLYLEHKINKNGFEVLKELEVKTQTQDMKPNKKFKKYDIIKANKRFLETGIMGERLVAEYLSKLVKQGQLATFTWYNEDGESGYPYDFSAQDARANVFYFDVKTTSFDFAQKMIFSSQEINYIAETDCKYHIYRVYKNDKDEYFLRICEDCKELSKEIWRRTEKFCENLRQVEVQLMSAKLAIPTTMQSLRFRPEIMISTN